MRLQDKIAIVTGAASGFGRATAVRFAQEGAHVAVVDIDETWGKETVSLAEQAGGRAVFVRADISSSAGARECVEAAVAQFGGLDVLVNNAGVAAQVLEDTWDAPEEEWDRILGINLKGVFLCSKYAIPRILERGGGAIVNIASISASSAVGGAAYGATKGGVLSYTRHVAIELADRGIRVNAVSPGHMRTPMSTGERRGFTPEQTSARMQHFARITPLGRPGEADDIANAVVYLASDEARFVTGQELVVDGGFLVRGSGRYA